VLTPKDRSSPNEQLPAAGDNPVTLGHFASDDIYSIAQGGVSTPCAIDKPGRFAVGLSKR
jgi:hypothetical protein